MRLRVRSSPPSRLLEAYRHRLRRAWSERQAAAPSWLAEALVHAGWIAAFATAAIAIWVSPPFRPAGQFDEGGVVSAVSAFLLASGSAFALTAFYVRLHDRAAEASFWLLATVAFAFLSLDEVLQIHEWVDDYVSDRFGESPGFRNWNDLVVIGYGLAAAAGLAAFLPEVVRYPKVLEIYVVAFLLYAVHTGIDSLVATPSAISMAWEESAKLMSVAAMTAGTASALACLLGGKPARPRPAA